MPSIVPIPSMADVIASTTDIANPWFQSLLPVAIMFIGILIVFAVIAYLVNIFR